MNKDEAIRLLQATKLMLLGKDNQPTSDLYYAVDEGIEALEKQIPMKPQGMRLAEYCIELFVGYCPVCHVGLNSEFNYCCNCGRKLDWSR